MLTNRNKQFSTIDLSLEIRIVYLYVIGYFTIQHKRTHRKRRDVGVGLLFDL